MYSFSKAEIANAAREANFVRDSYEKVLRLIETLRVFSEDKLLSENLLLKGGTAINLTLFELSRLSVDVDFDFGVNLPKEQMLETRKVVGNRIEKYMASGGYTKNPKSRVSYALDSFVFEYTNSAGVKDNLKVEINYALREHIFERQERQILASETKILPVVGLKVKTVYMTEIVASKFVALITRTAPRDLYDIFQAIASGLFNDFCLLQNTFVFYAAITAVDFAGIFNIKNIMGLTPYDIKRELLPMLRKGEHFDLSAVQNTVADFAALLFEFTEGQKEFLDKFAAGNYLPELLFWGEPLERAKKHPMALWKCSCNKHGKE